MVQEQQKNELMEQSQRLMETVAKGQYNGGQQEKTKDDRHKKRKRQEMVQKLLRFGTSQ